MFFLEDKLNQVALQPIEPINGINVRSYANALLGPLRTKYGLERSATGMIHEWVSGSTKVVMLVMKVDEASSFSIICTANPTADSKNL